MTDSIQPWKTLLKAASPRSQGKLIVLMLRFPLLTLQHNTRNLTDKNASCSKSSSLNGVASTLLGVSLRFNTQEL